MEVFGHAQLLGALLDWVGVPKQLQLKKQNLAFDYMVSSGPQLEPNGLGKGLNILNKTSEAEKPKKLCSLDPQTFGLLPNLHVCYGQFNVWNNSFRMHFY